MPRSDVVVRVAGEGGEGVISVAEILTQSAVDAGYDVFTFRSYPAEIKGGLAMMQVRIAVEPVRSIGRGADVLMAFNQEAIDVWGQPQWLEDGATVLYDPRHARLGEAFPATGVEAPIHDTSMSVTGARISKNIVALAALVRAIGLDPAVARALVEKKFRRKGDDIVRRNLDAFAAGLALGESPALASLRLAPPRDDRGERVVLSGNQSLSLGALAAGVRFVAGYPITPATQVLEFMMKYLPALGGSVVQAEDEISALAHCLGASFAGARAMTATSGPGMCLMSELIGMASMSEIPVVIADVMRSGPGTGMPTKTEQGDLMFAVHGSAGEAPRIVIAATGIEDAFYRAVDAFNLAERFQTPVILLTDQAMAYRTRTLSPPDLSAVPTVSRATPDADALADYRRYVDTDSGVSPMAIPGTAGGEFVMSGLEHDERGKANYAPDNRTKMTRKRWRKLDTLAAELDGNGNGVFDDGDGAEVGVIAWGATEGPIREAIARARAGGLKVAHCHPRVVFPLATRSIRRFVEPLRRLIVVEENFTGQFAQHLRAHVDLGDVEVVQVNQCTGLPFTSDDVYAELERHA